MNSISHFIFVVFNRLFPSKFSKDSFIISAKNIQWVGVSKIATMILSFVTTSVVARAFGPETFGTLSYALGFVGLFAILANLGVSTIVYKELIISKEKREEILGSSIALTLIAGLVTIGLILILLSFTQESYAIKVMIFMVSLTFLTQPLNLLQIDFLKDSEAKYATVAQLITYLISNAAKIIIVTFNQNIFYFIIILILENALAGAIYIFQIIKIKKRTLFLTISKKQIISILYMAAPMALMTGFSDIYSRIDQVMLKHYLDVTAVGVYSAAARLTEIWYFIPNIIITGLFPLLVKHQPTHQKNNKFRFLAKMLFLASMIIAIMTFFTSNLLISIIYGAKFSAASPLLSIYIFSLPGTFVSLLILQELFIEKKTWLVVFLPASTAILNILLNLVLIPIQGANGAAIATVISYNAIPAIYYVFKKINKEVTNTQKILP